MSENRPLSQEASTFTVHDYAELPHRYCVQQGETFVRVYQQLDNKTAAFVLGQLAALEGAGDE